MEAILAPQRCAQVKVALPVSSLYLTSSICVMSFVPFPYFQSDRQFQFVQQFVQIYQYLTVRLLDIKMHLITLGWNTHAARWSHTSAFVWMYFYEALQSSRSKQTGKPNRPENCVAAMWATCYRKLHHFRILQICSKTSTHAINANEVMTTF